MHKDYRVYRWKTETESTNWGRVYLYHELIGQAAFLFGVGFTDILLRDLFDSNLVIIFTQICEKT